MLHISFNNECVYMHSYNTTKIGFWQYCKSTFPHVNPKLIIVVTIFALNYVAYWWHSFLSVVYPYLLANNNNN